VSTPEDVIFPEDQDDDVLQLLPEDDEPPTAEEAFEDMEESIEDFPGEDDLVVTAPESEPVGRSWSFNYAARSFISGSKGHGPAETYGDETLRQWIVKCLMTDRGAHPIHSDQYGVESLSGIMGVPVVDLDTGDFEQRIREALMFHSRIADVREFEWDLDPDNEGVFVTFEVVLDDDETLSIENVRLIS
jgi:Protein of unknown function (DUF2634)